MTNDLKHLDVQGVRVPALGLGTWKLQGEECVEAVTDALEIGYRHLDTAQSYGNEEEVGEGIRRSGVKREEVWVTTKVSWEKLSHDECLESAGESLKRLRLSWIFRFARIGPTSWEDGPSPFQADAARPPGGGSAPSPYR